MDEKMKRMFLRILYAPLIILVAIIKTTKISFGAVKGKGVLEWDKAIMDRHLEYNLEIGHKMLEDSEYRKQCKTTKERLVFLWNEIVS